MAKDEKVVDRKKGVSKGGVAARSQNIPADIVEAIEKIREEMGKEVARPSFSKLVLAAIRHGLPKVARECKPRAEGEAA